MDDLESRAEALAMRLALEVLWTAFLQDTPDPIATAQRLGRESADIFRKTDAGTAEFRELGAKHSENLWQSIEHRIAASRGQTLGSKPR